MITVSPQTPVFVYRKAIDFRNGIDGLCGICKYELKEDPFSGSLFVFTNKKRISLKILVYDGQGFWVYHKRLSEGKFTGWPDGDDDLVSILARELMVLIWNGDPKHTKMAEDWKKLDKRK